MPTKVPSPILSKTFGMVMNIRDGPAWSVLESSPEKANTAGMISQTSHDGNCCVKYLDIFRRFFNGSVFFI